MEFGLSFNPQQAQNPLNPQQPGGSQTPIQDAIRTLSLRIPTFRGPGIAPQPLMTSPGAGGVMGAQGMPGGLQQILAQIFGRMQPAGGAPMGQAPAPSPSGIPLPNFTPGEEKIPGPTFNPGGAQPDMRFTDPPFPKGKPEPVRGMI